MKKSIPAILALAALAGHLFLTWGVVDWPTHLIFAGLILVLGWGGLRVVAVGLEQLRKNIWLAMAAIAGGLIIAYPGTVVPLYPGLSDDALDRLPLGSVTLGSRANRVGWAIHYHDVETAQRLLELGIGDRRLRNRDGLPILFHLSEPDLITLLADHGEDPNAQDGEGKTPLFHTRDPRVAEELLRAGANPNHKDLAGYSPLMLLRNAEDEPYARTLIAAGGDLAARDPAGKVAAQRLPPALQQALVADASLLSIPNDTSIYEANRHDALSWVTENITADEPVTVIAAEGPLKYYQTGTLLIRVANSRSEELRLTVEADIGVAALFVGASHGGRAEEPSEAGMQRTIVWDSLVLPAGKVGQVSLTLIARGSDSGMLSVSVSASDYRNGFDHHGSYLDDLRPPEGSWENSTLGFLIFMLVPLSFMGFVFLKMRFPDSAFTAAFSRFAAIVGALFTGFVCFSITMSEFQQWTQFVPTQCEVLDRRIFLESSGSSDSGPTRVPLIAARYSTHAGERISAGFSGNTSGSVKALESIALGSVIDCWYDPERPGEFVVDATLSVGWLIFGAVFGIIALGLAYLAVRPRSARR